MSPSKVCLNHMSFEVLAFFKYTFSDPGTTVTLLSVPNDDIARRILYVSNPTILYSFNLELRFANRCATSLPGDVKMEYSVCDPIQQKEHFVYFLEN